MDVEIVGKFLSTLPEEDDHPYRTGPWRPQTTEWDADDLIAVEGEVPRDLDGIYLRNTENPLHPAIVRYHPFDGDGMIHKVSFRDGTVSYRNRFVRTDGLLAEQEAGRSLWAGLAENPAVAVRADGWGARGGGHELRLSGQWREQCGPLPGSLDPEGDDRRQRVREHPGQCTYHHLQS